MNREELKRLWFSLDYSNVKEKKEVIVVSFVCFIDDLDCAYLLF